VLSVFPLVSGGLRIDLSKGDRVLRFDQFGIAISFTGLVLLFILAAALGGVIYLAEMLSYRREWLRSGPPAVTKFRAS
jgi:hypothetical protein